MEQRRSTVYPEMYGDPIVDRAHIARRAIDSLRRSRPPRGTELGLVLRERIAMLGRIVRGSGETPPPAAHSYPEENVRTALFDGVAIRALIPEVAAVSFGPPEPKLGRNYRYGVYTIDGEVTLYEPATLDSLLRSHWVYEW
jgi:hypothetical protein